MKLSVTAISNRRVSMTTARQANPTETGEVEIAVDVVTPSYVPEGVTVRARLSDLLFTATTDAGNLDRLENDPLVKSIQVSRPLRAP